LTSFKKCVSADALFGPALARITRTSALGHENIPRSLARSSPLAHSRMVRRKIKGWICYSSYRWESRQ